jgi:gas vesicle protein
MIDSTGFTTRHLVYAFLAGAAAGAVTAYLTSPGSGRENREALRRAANDLRTRAVDGVTQVQARVGRAARAAREAFAEPGDGRAAIHH